MELNYQVLDKILSDLTQTDGQITVKCADEIGKFIQTHDFDVFSDETRAELTGIFRVSLNGVYEAMTGDYLPNIFVKKDF